MTVGGIDNDLVLRRRIAAPADRVFAAWTTPDTMRRWLAPGPCAVVEVKNDLRVGGCFRIVSEAPDGVRHVITGRYVQIEPERRLEMTWLYRGPIEFLDGVETLLEVDVADFGDGTAELTLTQTRIRTPIVYEAFAADWPSCLNKLEGEVARSLH